MTGHESVSARSGTTVSLVRRGEPRATAPGQRGDAERVSVVLATYNGAQYLGEQLASILAMIRLPDEMVIVDDASTDDTAVLLEDFRDRAPFPVDLVLRHEHLGTWTTFEEGLARATGDILVICDQDDRWHPEKLSVMASRLAEDPEALMAFSDARLINPEGRLIGRSRWRVAGFSTSCARLVSLDPIGPLFGRQAVSGCTLAMRAELLPAVLPFPGDIHPALTVMMYDRWISLVAAVAAPVITVPERLVDYRIHPGQQVGIPALRLRRMAPVLALHLAQFLHGRAEIDRRMSYHLAHFDEIEKRLHVAAMASTESDARLASARQHVGFRQGLPLRRRRRLRAVAGELRRRDGYRRFSLGAASAVADVTR